MPQEKFEDARNSPTRKQGQQSDLGLLVAALLADPASSDTIKYEAIKIRVTNAYTWSKKIESRELLTDLQLEENNLHSFSMELSCI